MQNYDCNHICEQFTEYQENTLPIETRAEIDSHLSVCQPCQRIFQELEQVLNQMHTLPSIQANPGFTQELISRIEHDKNQPIWEKIVHSSYTRVAGYAIAAGLVVALGLNIWLDPISTRSSSGVRGYSGGESQEDKLPEALVKTEDSLGIEVGDTLNIQRSTIKSQNQSLQLVSGSK